MSEPLLPRAENENLQPSDAERQLEGRAAIVVDARDLHVKLEQILASRAWRDSLTRSPELVPTLVNTAEAVREALARVHRRAELEDWPESTPVLRTAREVAKRRTRLHAVVRRRLAALGTHAGADPLEAALTRLDTLARQPANWALDLREVLILEMPARWSHPPGGSRGYAVQETALFGHAASWRGWVPGTGRVRLTNERLLWRSALAGPRCVRWEALSNEGLQLNAATRELRAGRDWGVFARRQTDAANLAALAEMVRWAPLRDALRTRRGRLETVALFSATLGESRGHCILTSEQLCFIPTGQGPRVLRAITSSDTSLPTFDANRLMDLLRWLSTTDLDSALDRILAAAIGKRWTRMEVRVIERPLTGTSAILDDSLHLECGGERMAGFPKDSEEVIANGLLRDYPRPPRSPWLP
ncbi:hypothetical protein [Myxococcus stipitatus]|uniref:hypothetical protein n=1 Tax=Myxococcus stipitatus TaxID=83455 RepID=UPI0030D0A431